MYDVIEIIPVAGPERRYCGHCGIMLLDGEGCLVCDPEDERDESDKDGLWPSRG